jgi:hypothetical protein
LASGNSQIRERTNDDLSYYLQIQSSLSHIQGGVENRKWEEQLQLIETVKNDYTKQIDTGAPAPTNNTSYLDFIPDREIPKLPELHLRMPTEVITIPDNQEMRDVDPTPPVAQQTLQFLAIYTDPEMKLMMAAAQASNENVSANSQPLNIFTNSQPPNMFPNSAHMIHRYIWFSTGG